jgi:3-dehydroquinate synthase
MSHAITVRHALGSYPVYVEPGLLQRLDRLATEHLPERRVAMLTDESVYQLYRAGRLGDGSWTGPTFRAPPGETFKTRQTWMELSDMLLSHGFGRDSGLIGLGGGVMGDLTGFVAATYMRGIPYLLVPTTLLAMVDASVGGKTGVNTPQGKNLIGAFYPPAAVLADPLTLRTLPEREYRGGLAEAVKHGLIADAAYFDWIESSIDSIVSRNPETVQRLVRRSVEIKAELVSQDEREAGRRAILNAGHTVAHALEPASNYQLSHGEAVALGLIAECALGERLGVTNPGIRSRLLRVLAALGLPVGLPGSLPVSRMMEWMEADKKNRQALIHCALVEDIGRMHRSGTDSWTSAVDRVDLAAAVTCLEVR